MKALLDPRFGFNCTAVLGYELSFLQSVSILQALCSAHTFANAALVQYLFEFCSSDDGFCRLDSLALHMRRLRSELLRSSAQVAGRLTGSLRQAVALSGRKTWHTSRCNALLYLSRQKYYSHVPVGNLLACMTGFKDASFMQWQVLMKYAMQQSRAKNGVFWFFDQQMHGGVPGENPGKDRHTWRSFVVYSLLRKVNSSKEHRRPWAAEIGVSRGSTSEILLKELPSLQMILVEPEITWLARTRMQPFRERVVWINAPSSRASYEVADESLDVVFIDGDHSYEAVREDIAHWSGKVRPGGYLSGHDFTPSCAGVVQAVNDFALQHNATINLQIDCWWFRKSADRTWK
ncbi:unnamed protein product [Durusdinium trenchii]|uniref:Class I SAM-dependent methyltransferase n=1 Tax=Durusdinium trenchii TaxID=1381693 RepID=A0ABP0KHX4_9DINO